MYNSKSEHWVRTFEKNKKLSDSDYISDMSRREKIRHLASEVSKLQGKLTENISKAISTSEDLDKLHDQSQTLLRRSRKFYKKSRKANLYQNGCCGCIFIIISEFFQPY